MANTTNFGWETPDDTDLVKDGASAMRTLGNAIDTSLVDLKGGTTGQVLSKASNTDMDFTWVAQDDSNAIQNALLTTTGDTIYASGASTPARLGIGSSGQVLTVSGGVPTWATPDTGGAYTSLATGTLSTTQVSIGSISSAYTDLLLYVNNPYVNTGSPLAFRVNADTSANYGSTTMNALGSTLTNVSGVAYFRPGDGTNLPTTASNHFYYLYIRNYASSITKTYVMGGTDSGEQSWLTNGGKALTAAISSIQIRTTGGTATFSGGTYTLYGVK